MQNETSFNMRGVRKAFGATQALDGVDLSVASGEILGLVGQNGAGKSTLMAILAGVLQPDAGSMTIDGRPYVPKSPIEARRAGVAMIHQELSLAPHLTVMENMLLGAEPAPTGRWSWVPGLVDWRAMRAQAKAALAQLGHDDIRPDAVVGDLSVAHQQLVEIARALAVGCRVLVLDEPTSSLGRDDVAHLFALLRRLKADGYAIVYISHFIEEVQAITDRYTVLRDGRNAGGGSTPESTPAAIVASMVGAAAGDLFARSDRQPGEPLLEVSGFEPGGATFTLRRGEVLGIAGLVGSGRTRFLRALFGLAPVKSGRVRIGAGGGGRTPRDHWRAGMGLLSEDRKNEGLAGSLSVADNLTLTCLQPFGPAGVVVPRRQRHSAAAWIARLAIKCGGPDQAAGELSGGNQQKVALARLLHHDVDVLLLDEPTRGIDVASKAQIYRLVDRLAAGADGAPAKAVLVVSSYFPELLGLCDRIAVMQRGRLQAPRAAAGLNEHDLLLDSSGGPSRA
ncbi:MAG TPA: sugar ABC transporter ATP-binding protein [Vicinamibacterales bacterium]|jgi:ribose transport system ATP-binding protein